MKSRDIQEERSRQCCYIKIVNQPERLVIATNLAIFLIGFSNLRSFLSTSMPPVSPTYLAHIPRSYPGIHPWEHSHVVVDTIVPIP